MTFGFLGTNLRRQAAAAAADRKQEVLSVTLTNKQKSFLSGKAHHLKPVVMVGHKGLSETLTQKVTQTSRPTNSSKSENQ